MLVVSAVMKIEWGKGGRSEGKPLRKCLNRPEWREGALEHLERVLGRRTKCKES